MDNNASAHATLWSAVFAEDTAVPTLRARNDRVGRATMIFLGVVLVFLPVVESENQRGGIPPNNFHSIAGSIKCYIGLHSTRNAAHPRSAIKRGVNRTMRPGACHNLYVLRIISEKDQFLTKSAFIPIFTRERTMTPCCARNDPFPAPPITTTVLSCQYRGKKQ